MIDEIDVPCPSYCVLEIRGLFPFLSARASRRVPWHSHLQKDGIMHEIMESQPAKFAAFIELQDA